MLSKSVAPLTVLSLAIVKASASYTPVYLFEISACNNARQCVQQCATTYSNFAVNKFGCEGGGVATCLCSDNVGQSSIIASWYSSCAVASCSNEPDASTAVEIWADYCSANAAANAPLPNPAVTTSATGDIFGGASEFRPFVRSDLNPEYQFSQRNRP
jgi:hypothetical protein